MIKRFVLLLKNLNYLSKFSLKDTLANTSVLTYEDLYNEIIFRTPNDKIVRPKIYSVLETVEMLQNTNYSIARFGDGEILIMEGKDIPFQKYEKKLAERLKEIVSNKQQNLVAGINHHYFNYSNLYEKNEFCRHFDIYEIPKLRKSLLKYITWDTQYCSTGLSWLFDYNDSSKDKYFEDFRQIWHDKKIAIVCCKNAFDNLKFNIFDNALEENYVFVPNKNAFSTYDETLHKLLALDKNTLIILMAGPAAKVWASDLTKEGFRALDLGHLAKSYDFYKRKIPNTGENELKFWGVDE